MHAGETLMVVWPPSPLLNKILKEKEQGLNQIFGKTQKVDLFMTPIIDFILLS